MRRQADARAAATRKVTVTELSREWGCSTDQILRLIHAGELPAMNVALCTSGRPRYLIDRDEIERFERRRSSVGASHRQSGPQRDKAVINYF